MNTITLIDPQTLREVHIRHAELPQRCTFCGAELQGTFIAAMDGGPGWVCLPHLERLLLSVEPSPMFAARAIAKNQLIHKNPGDVMTVTQSLLVAMEAW